MSTIFTLQILVTFIRYCFNSNDANHQERALVWYHVEYMKLSSKHWLMV